MSKNRIESKSTHITCDNSNCDYEDVEVTIENVEEYLNLECPNCGDILLTESDLNTFRVMKSTVNLINGMDDKTFDTLIDSYGGENSDEENDEERISVKVTSHEGIKFEIINGEKNKEENG